MPAWLTFKHRYLILGVALIIAGGVSLFFALQNSRLSGIHKIKHVVVIMQENRSFDSYFGTFPGADGIPMKDGIPTVCVPDTATGQCVSPYHDTNDVNQGGPHGQADAANDIDGGKMNGFIDQLGAGGIKQGPAPDVMGYHDGGDIPNYWSYAKNFVLQDRMFEPNASWSLPAHLFMVSEWSAKCTSSDPNSCQNALQSPGSPPDFGKKKGQKAPSAPDYAWTDLTYLLHKNNISWRYYVFNGTEPDCQNDSDIFCAPKVQNSKTPGIWNPLPYFDTVREDNELGNIQTIDNFYQAAKEGSLPAVSWIDPSGPVSEHPPAAVTTGQTYVTGLVNVLMNGPDWESTAIFISWDDWGGFYDHVPPPTVDQNGYGLRVPGLVISPYAKQGYIDNQVLSFDAYVKFIEDDFLNGQRLDPKTDGRPDPRPTVRENASILGDLIKDFNFNQMPKKPLILPTNPPTNLK